ncbi:hypothetical protein J2X54_003308 [Duganella sp. 3397]|uniref:hypothetical protein n=1 Tax=Duganella sp. 3397 TaxID=2817732 RepID=UPI0028622846|nr:hypothetical protein [Duganella sp. 3397]MDR7050821.1 hypothetical protein [Duganella sp. 3397]
METYSDYDTIKVANKEFGPKAYILTLEEAIDESFGIVPEINKYFLYLRERFPHKINPTFAIARMLQPMRIFKTPSEEFIIVISESTIYHILKLASHLQSLHPISDFLHLKTQPIKEYYNATSLVDITRSWILSETEFYAEDLNCAFAALFFMIAHEYAHFAHGHIDFQQSDEFRKFDTPAEVDRTK